MKWLARFVLVVIVAALFAPWRPVMVPLTENGHYVPFGVVILMLLGGIALGIGIVLGLLWLLVKAGVVKDES